MFKFIFSDLPRWLEKFKLNETLLVVNHADLIQRPYEVVKKVEAFIGAPSIISPDMIYFNKTRGFHCKYLDPIKNQTKCMWSNKGRKHATAPPEIKKIFQEYFKSGNTKFFKAIGQDFGWNNIMQS